MNFDVNTQLFLVSLVPIVISILAYLNSRKSRIAAEESLKLSKSAKRIAEIEYLKTTPSLDVVGVVKASEKYRVKLLISNMRSSPFRINSLMVLKRKLKKRNLKNYLYSKYDPDFNWDYEKIEGVFWNPKGNLDNEEYYVSEAGEFSVVKDKEFILVTVPDFNEHEIYSFQFHTTHGNTDITGRISKNNRTLFCTEFRQSFT